MLKALVVGCGRIAGGGGMMGPSTHGGAYSSCDRVQLVACVDSCEESARKYASYFDCDAESTIQEAIEKHRPDIVSLCTPDATHFNLSVELLTCQYPPRILFLEKPACRTESELSHLQWLALDRSVDVVVNHSRRFDLHHQELRKRISDGEFGEFREAYVTYYSGWEHNGVHIIDTLAFLLDDEVKILAINNSMKSPYAHDPTFEIKACFSAQQGRINIFGFDEQDYQLFELDLRFSSARLRIEDFGARIILEHQIINEIGERVLVSIQHGLSEKKESPMQRAMELICKRWEQNNPSLLDGYRLNDIAVTMNTIWEGKKIYGQN